MRLVVKHVRKTKAGNWQYRRQVPEALRAAVGKREIKEFLGSSEAEAVRRHPKVHAKAEALLSLARGRKPNDAPALVTAMDEFRRVVEQIKDLGLNHETTGDLDDWITRDVIAEQIEQQDGDPALYRAVVSGIGKEPEPTLEDALRLYLKERVKGDKAKQRRVERVVKHVRTALGRDPVLTSLRRSDAREVRDHMLDVINSPSTVERYLNDLRAIVNLGLKEFDRGAVVNPFMGLEVQKETLAKDDREPFSPEQLKATRARVMGHAGVDLQRIRRMLEGTGCRLSEVTGLLVSDVRLDHKHPHISLVFHPHRRLKTKGSVRNVPLVGDALGAAQEAVRAAQGETLLFPSYGRPRGGDAASAVLMKHLRTVVSDKKVTVHSLRHSMKDRLVRADVPLDVRNIILGQSSGAVSEAYGGDEARLEVAARALEKALT